MGKRVMRQPKPPRTQAELQAFLTCLVERGDIEVATDASGHALRDEHGQPKYRLTAQGQAKALMSQPRGGHDDSGTD